MSRGLFVTWRMGSQDLVGSVVNNHGDCFCPLKGSGCGTPDPNGRIPSWLINGGYMGLLIT